MDHHGAKEHLRKYNNQATLLTCLIATALHSTASKYEQLQNNSFRPLPKTSKSTATENSLESSISESLYPTLGSHRYVPNNNKEGQLEQSCPLGREDNAVDREYESYQAYYAASYGISPNLLQTEETQQLYPSLPENY